MDPDMVSLQTALMAAVSVLAAAIGYLWRDAKAEAKLERRRWQEEVARILADKCRLAKELEDERLLFRQELDEIRSELRAERLQRESEERRHYQDAMLFLTALARKQGRTLESMLPLLGETPEE